jgi:hypothetical protein
MDFISLQAGQFQTIDTNSLAPTPLSMQPVNTHGNYITSFDISETCLILNFLCQEKKKGDLLIQVTSWTGLTVLYTSSFDK